MHLVVYIDLIFFVNVVMDFVVLFIMKELLKEQTTLRRLSIAAVIAALGGCIAIVFHCPVILRFLFLYVFTSAIVLRIAFRIKDAKEFIGKLLAFFGIAFFVDGFLNFLYYRVNIEKYYKEAFAGTVFGAVSVIYLIACLGCLILVYPLIAFVVVQIREKILLLRKVQLENQGRKVKGIGLMDTGNLLFDPLSGEPVIIAEFCWVKELFSVEQQLALVSYMKMSQVVKEGPQTDLPVKIRMIPYHSVGNEEGLLVAVRLDSILIGEQSGLKRWENVLVGLYPGRLSAKKEYQVILHNGLT